MVLHMASTQESDRPTVQKSVQCVAHQFCRQARAKGPICDGNQSGHTLASPEPAFAKTCGASLPYSLRTRDTTSVTAETTSSAAVLQTNRELRRDLDCQPGALFRVPGTDCRATPTSQ